MNVGAGLKQPVWGWVAAAAASAGLFAGGIGLSPGLLSLLLYLCPIPLLAVAWAMGGQAAGLAGLLAAALLLLLTDGLHALLFIILLAGPIAVLGWLARQARPDADGTPVWYPAGRLVAVLAGLNTVLLVIFSLWADQSVAGGLAQALTEQLRTQLQAAAPTMPSETAAQMELILPQLAMVMPSGVAFFWLALMICGAAAAYLLLRQFNIALRPWPSLMEMDLPLPLAGAFLLAALAGLLGEGMVQLLGINAALCLAVPYLLAGLAVVHAFVARFGRGPRLAMLVIFYGVGGLLAWPLLLAALLGAADQMMGLRHRLLAAASQEGSKT